MALAGVLVASNLHLAVVQGVAWVRMYEHYRVGYSPMMALEVTLSGQAPCHLCKFVQAAEKTQQKFDGLLAWSAKVLLPVQATELRLAPAEQRLVRRSEPAVRLVAQSDRPEVPPPRWA